MQSYSLTVACHIFGGLTILISLIFAVPCQFSQALKLISFCLPFRCETKSLELVSFGLSQSCMILPQLLISAASGSTTAWSFPYHEMTQAMPGGPMLLGRKSGVFGWSGEETGASTEWVLSCVPYSDIFSITLGLYMPATCAVNHWGRRLPLNPLSSWSHEQLKGQPQAVAADASCDTVFCVFSWEGG